MYIDLFLLEDSAHAESPDEWIAAISGLDVGTTSPSDAQIQMLAEYLIGEGGNVDDQVASANITRLVIAGASLAAVTPMVTESAPSIDDKKAVRVHMIIRNST